MAKFETKFDVGDKVYRLLSDGFKWNFLDKGNIILVQATKNTTGAIMYECFVGGCWYDEGDLFKHKEEAQAECDRRNKE